MENRIDSPVGRLLGDGAGIERGGVELQIVERFLVPVDDFNEDRWLGSAEASCQADLFTCEHPLKHGLKVP